MCIDHGLYNLSLLLSGVIFIHTTMLCPNLQASIIEEPYFFVWELYLEVSNLCITIDVVQ